MFCVSRSHGLTTTSREAQRLVQKLEAMVGRLVIVGASPKVIEKAVRVARKAEARAVARLLEELI